MTPKTEETEDTEMEIKETKCERKLVIPGETIASGEDYLPGDFTRKEGSEVIANRYGLAEISGRVVKIIPISGVFEPRRGNNVIGRVEDINFSGWMIDIGGPYSSFLPLMECPRFINRNNIAEFANIGDVIHAKILGVKKGGVDLTLKSRGLGPLENGRLIKINPNKVPRVIGKEGSMINLIKDNTKTEITVGQNGFVWVKGELDGEEKAEKAISLIVEESSNSGLTEKIEKFLGGKK
ncbi:MAG: exosome complex RNA-binding protein Rrp4 [Candidatus Nanoarchaeia archaeon]|nr:exosome complex RNA-binding protein Rrp4 [Candidatus Nanoarchaeia archaeon]